MTRRIIIAGERSAAATMVAVELAKRLQAQVDIEYPEFSEEHLLNGDGTGRQLGLLSVARPPEPPTEGDSRQVRRARARRGRA